MSARILDWDTLWRLFGERDEMHVVPVDDLVAHELENDCVCGPYIEFLGGQDFLVAHEALDGRP